MVKAAKDFNFLVHVYNHEEQDPKKEKCFKKGEVLTDLTLIDILKNHNREFLDFSDGIDTIDEIKKGKTAEDILKEKKKGKR